MLIEKLKNKNKKTYTDNTYGTISICATTLMVQNDIYIYMCVCVCVCVCMKLKTIFSKFNRYFAVFIQQGFL